MPDRVFRDEILSSPRYWHLSSDTARMLFFHLGLRADDFGIFRAANYTIRQECFGADNKIAPEALTKMLSELNDADLIRLYVSDEGVEYGFIPRWKQRLRIIKSKYPYPPASLRDISINELIAKMSDECPTDVRHMSAEVKGKERGLKGNETKKSTSHPPPVDNSEKVHSWREHWTAEGHRRGIKPHPGETAKAYCDRVILQAKEKTK